MDCQITSRWYGSHDWYVTESAPNVCRSTNPTCPGTTKVERKWYGESVGETTSILTQLLQTDADQWDLVLSRHNPAVLKEVLSEVQRTTESIVFALEAGSMAQRVQAEYMQELMKRVESAIARKQE